MFFPLAQPFTAGGLGQGMDARFIGLPLSLELKQAWKPDESGLQFDLSDTQPLNGWAREKKASGTVLTHPRHGWDGKDPMASPSGFQYCLSSGERKPDESGSDGLSEPSPRQTAGHPSRLRLG